MAREHRSRRADFDGTSGAAVGSFTVAVRLWRGGNGVDWRGERQAVGQRVRVHGAAGVGEPGGVCPDTIAARAAGHTMIV